MTRSEIDPDKLRKIEQHLAEHQALRAQIVSKNNTPEERAEMREIWNTALGKMREVCSCFCEAARWEMDD